MCRQFVLGMIAVLLVPLVAATARAEATSEAELERLLLSGDMTKASGELQRIARLNPDDGNAQMALGVAQVLGGVETLGQSLYRFGLKPHGLLGMVNMPFVRLPVPTNPKPDPLTNAQFRRMVERFERDLQRAEQTLSKIDQDDVRLPLHVGLLRLDLDGDDLASVDEALWKLLARTTGTRLDQATAEGFVVTLDKADVHWLRGYCHLLQALCDVFLAYDTQELHDLTAHIFFPKAQVRYEFLQQKTGDTWRDDIMDLITFIHLWRLPVVEPDRMPAAREHLLEVIRQSRLCWEAIAAETDDDHEWIPGAHQQDAAAPFFRVSKSMIDRWGEILDETERILNGERLLPFWRGTTKQGVNLRRVFEEPRTFDFVLWAQGSGAGPYLEDGEVTSRQFWRETQQVFSGRLWWFSFWVN
ncbi:MAG: hypothetical protein CMJ58_15630 [Planctomycetaceae bacterium]|nr:hypothetical protein [Planctomycetaceae bacterium]